MHGFLCLRKIGENVNSWLLYPNEGEWMVHGRWAVYRMSGMKGQIINFKLRFKNGEGKAILWLLSVFF